jgi:hypothetical protein
MLLEIEQKMYSVQEAVYKGKLSTEHEDKVLKNQEASNKINKIISQLNEANSKIMPLSIQLTNACTKMYTYVTLYGPSDPYTAAIMLVKETTSQVFLKVLLVTWR